MNDSATLSPSRRASSRAAPRSAPASSLGFRLSLARRRPRPGRRPRRVFAPNAVAPHRPRRRVTIINRCPRWARASLTAMPMIVAEELDADWSKVRVEQAPADPKRLRQSGHRHAGRPAAAAACATTWRRCARPAPPRAQMLVAGRRRRVGRAGRRGRHRARRRRAPADRPQARLRPARRPAPQLPVPQKPDAQGPRPVPLHRQGARTASTPRQGQRARPSSASTCRCPACWSALDRAAPVVRRQGEELRRRRRPRRSRASSTWSQVDRRRRRGRRPASGRRCRAATRSRSTWDDGADGQRRPATQIASEYAARSPGSRAWSRATTATPRRRSRPAARRSRRSTRCPSSRTRCMEPMNCTAHVTPGRLRGLGAAPRIRAARAGHCGARSPDSRRRRSPCTRRMLGGGFGRRGETDFVVDAVRDRARRSARRSSSSGPARTTSSTASTARPRTTVPAPRSTAGGSRSRGCTASSGPVILAPAGPRCPARTASTGRGRGRRATLPYDIPNLQRRVARQGHGVPLGFWRSVGSLAERVHHRELHRRAGARRGQGPVRVPARAARQVTRATRRCSSWRRRRPAGARRCPRDAARGIAVRSPTAATSPTWPRSRWPRTAPCGSTASSARSTAGIAVNPDQVKAQMEGGAVYALTAALYGADHARRGACSRRTSTTTR